MLYTPTETGPTSELKQVVLAFKLNATYSKAQILALYAEVAYYGHGYYGLEQASCGYFGHPAADLTVSQGAMLAGVVNAPSLDDPIADPVSARPRLEHVIARMVAVGDLTGSQATAALAAPLESSLATRQAVKAPVSYVARLASTSSMCVSAQALRPRIISCRERPRSVSS